MKKPIHLYIFAVLSAISCLLRVYSAFFVRFNEEELRASLQGMQGDGVEQLISYNKTVTEFSANIINKGFAVVLLLILIAVIVFLFKKQNERASYVYIVYLVGTLLAATYSYVGLKSLAGVDGIISYLINAVLFFIYFGITVYFLLRKPKETPSTAQNSTDI